MIGFKIPGEGSKVKTFFSESSHVASQLNFDLYDNLGEFKVRQMELMFYDL